MKTIMAIGQSTIFELPIILSAIAYYAIALFTAVTLSENLKARDLEPRQYNDVMKLPFGAALNGMGILLFGATVSENPPPIYSILFSIGFYVVTPLLIVLYVNGLKKTGGETA